MENKLENKEKGVSAEGVKSEENSKPYTLKKLSAANVFTFATILKKVGLDEIKACLKNPDIVDAINSKDRKLDINKIGILVLLDIVSILIANLEACKKNIYILLSDLSGMSEDQIDTLDAEVFMEMIMDVLTQEGFANFFKVVFRFLS